MKYALTAVALAATIGSAAAVAEWGQCGGINYTGSKTCDSGLNCVIINDCEHAFILWFQDANMLYRLLPVPEGRYFYNHPFNYHYVQSTNYYDHIIRFDSW